MSICTYSTHKKHINDGSYKGNNLFVVQNRCLELSLY